MQVKLNTVLSVVVFLIVMNNIIFMKQCVLLFDEIFRYVALIVVSVLEVQICTLIN